MNKLKNILPLYNIRINKQATLPIHILLIEDSEGDSFLIQEALTDCTNGKFIVVHAPTVEDAEKEYVARVFDVLLLDMNLPGLSGLEAVEKVRKDQPGIPIIVMTGMDDEERALSAMQRGVQDYLVKGNYTNEVLPRSIRYAIERQRFENKVIQLIHFDQVTGLINREVFLERLEGAISLASQNNMPLAVLLINLKQFKDVNATLGHDTGNKLLKTVATRLREYILPHDAIARLEGDEFIVMVAGNQAIPENLTHFAQGIIDTIRTPFEVDGQSINIGCNIGVATYPSCGKDGTELMKHADIALHRAKQSSKDEFHFYTQKLNEELMERILIEKELRIALKERALSAWYQPIIDMRTNRVCGVETLLRWQHPTRGFIPPSTFIPIAEKTDLIMEISEYVMNAACTDYAVWENLVQQPFYVAINLSTKDLQKTNFPDRLNNILQKTKMNPKHIALEITEGSLMEDPKQTITALQQCRQAGAAIFVDDFGTGYSSLSYLSLLPLDVLKIDQSFVRDILTNKHNRMIANSTINLAHGLGLHVVAEGIETTGQLELLKMIGCDKAQGFHFAKPMPISELLEWLTGYHSRVAV